jgi:hypothetical protein
MSIILNGSAGVTTNSGAVYDGIASGTAVTASGTSVDFTGIPSWAKRITVMFSGISKSGTSNILIQLGDSGGIENTNYLGTCWTANVTNTNYSTGFLLTAVEAAADISHGQAIISLVGSNVWVNSSLLGRSNNGTAHSSAGSKTLSDTLTQVRITTVNGTDTFDAGSINILYE